MTIVELNPFSIQIHPGPSRLCNLRTRGPWTNCTDVQTHDKDDVYSGADLSTWLLAVETPNTNTFHFPVGYNPKIIIFFND